MFDLDGARKAGYSDTEIANFLAPQLQFDAKGARAAGYSDSEIAAHLATLKPVVVPPSAPADVSNLSVDPMGNSPQQATGTLDDAERGVKSYVADGLGRDVNDVVQGLGAGVASGEQQGLEMVHQLLKTTPPGRLLNFIGDQLAEKTLGRTAQDAMGDVADTYRAGYSPEAQAAQKKEWWDEKRHTFGSAWSDPSAYITGMAESLPGSLATMIPGVALARGAYAAKMGAMLAEGAAKDVATEAAAKAASSAAGWAGSIAEGLQGGAQSAMSVRDDINRMTPQELQSSDAYKALLAQGLTPEAAKRALAEDGSTKGFLLGGVATGIFGGMGDRVLARAITKGIEGGAVKRTVLGALSEGILEEFPQNYAQQVGENVSKLAANPNQSLTEGALNQAMGGAAIGAIQGGGMAGAFGHSAERTASKVEITGDLKTDLTNILNAPVTPVAEPSQTTIPTPTGSSSASPVVSDGAATGQDAAAVASSSAALDKVEQQLAPAASGDILRASDSQPFGSATAAQLEAKDRGLEGYQPVEVPHGEGTGFVLRKTMTKEEIDASAREAATSPHNDLPEPTQAQKDAGNYKLAPAAIHGLELSIENPEGSTRSGVGADGKPWSVTMANHYGYIKGTTGADSTEEKHQHVDAFIGPNPESRSVFVVDQVNKDGSFDEHKAMLGFNTKEEADAAYHANYAKGWTGRGAITEMPIEQFREWVKDPAQTAKPLADLPAPSSAPTDATMASEATTQPASDSATEAPQNVEQGQQDEVKASAIDTGGAGDVTAVSVLNAGLKDRGIEAAVAQPADVAGWMRDPVHRTVIESSRAFGALFGKRVVFVKSAQKGVDLPFNGAVRSLSAPRHIFVNAESPEVSPLAVAGHELTHLIRSQAPDLYKALAKVVTENSDHQSFDTDFRARFKGTQLTRGQIHEEMVADIVGNRILEPATWRAMAERDPNKFRAFATRVIAQLAEWIGKAKKSFAVDHLIVGDMEKIREQLVETLAQYTAHNEQPETKERYARHDEVAASAKAGGLPDQGAVRGGEEPVAVDGGPDQGSRRSLEGAPTEVDIPGRGKVFFGISEKVRAVKRAYAAKAGIPYVEQTKYVKVDRERATRIAAEYDKMVHDLNDPEVMEAYNAMAKETIAQYEAILEHHPELKIEFIDYAKTGDPYAATPRLAILDVLENNHFAVFSTRDGYGSSEFDPSASPMLAETQHKISGQVALVNDLFRVVHDYFGHIENGVGFRADGEENAWRSHSTMYSPLARRAMTSETRGQNSWVNFGPHGEVNRTANGADTIYADQKVGLMPAWVSEDGAFDDTQLSAKEREGDVISTRNPTGKTAKENAITQMLPIDLEAMQRDKAAFAHNVGIVTSYVGYRNEGARTPAQKAERFIEQAKGNLLWLHDAMAKELRDRAKLWYDGANKIARDFSRNYSISTRQASGILAALSPQKDWFQNVSLAKRVIEVLAQHQKTAWTPEMTKTADRLAQTSNNEVIDAVRGKKLGDLTDNVERAAWVRIFDETYNAKSYPVVTPEGNFEGLAQNGNGSATQVAWGGFNTIANAVSIYHDGSIENISARLGEQHKVRSFYNNIVAPKSEDGHVTIDTHAVAAALGRPLSGSSAEVLHNFGNNVKGEPGPTNSRIYGTMGTYGLYAEAYRRAAEERGILPREMQSITWEAVRGLFSPEFKRNQIQLAKNNEGVRARDQVDTIDHIWENYAHGDITAKQARSAVLKAAGGIATPEWAGGRPAGEVDGVAQHPGDAREVPVAGVPGRDAAVDGGTRSAAAAEPAAAVPEDVAFSRSQAQEDFADFDPLTDSDRPPYAGAKKHDGYWLSRDGQYVAAPAGGFGWTAVRVRDLPFMQEHGFGGSHLDRYLSGAIDRVAQGKDFSDVRAKFIKELKPLAPTDAKERAEMLAHFDAAMAAFQQGGVEFSRKFEPEALKQRVKDELEAALNSKRSVSLWDRTVGTKINLARKSPEFKAVFDKANEFIRDISYFAARAADQAPNLLPKLESVKTLGKGFLGTMTGERQANLKAAGDAIYAGTLDKTRYTGEELQRMGLSPEARTFYNEARAAVDTSLEQTGTSIMARLARTEGLDVGNIREMTMMKARDAVTKELRARRDAVHAELTNEQQLLAMKSDEFTKVLTPEALAATLANATEKVQALQRKYDALVKSIDDVNDVAGRVVDLQNEGYFPLMRFGDYTVYATQKNGRSTEQLFFGMYETEAERVKMARNLRQLYPNAQVVEGVANDEYHKLFAGINLDSLEVFAQAMGASEQEVFQSYLKLAVANRSALKRMIERKAVPGFDADVTRTLAQFLTSNARMASRNYHWAEAKAAANAIPKEKGDLQKEAVRLLSYIENPEEEGQTIRGLNFMWQMAGNISTAIINMMQPAQTTFPYLSRYGVSNATAALAKGAKTLTGKGIDADLARALKLAADKGITQPHEIHQLYGAQQRTPGVVGQRFGAVWQRGMRLMGEPFALAEAFNRHVTFVAAYEIGKQLTPAQLEKEGVKDAFGFAMKTVDDTQFVYNKANRPNWSRGSIQALIFQFKNYSISTVELFSHLARSGPEGRRAAAIMLGMWMLAAGFMGLPYEEDLEDLIDTVGQTLGFDTNIRASLRDGFFKGAQAILGQKLGEVFAEVMMHGASGALPLDVQGRFSLSNMIPATGVAKRSSANRRGKELSELLGPSGSLIDSMFKAIDSFQSGDGAPPQALPSYARNFAQFWDMIRTGTYRDDKGRSVVKTDKLDAAIKLLGFQPSVVAKEQRKLQVLTEQLDLQKVAEKDFTERIAKAVGDAAMVDTPKAEAAADREIEQTMADVERWNTRNPDTPVSITSSQIRKRVQEMMLERSTRLLKSAPREMRGIIGSHLNPED